MKITPHYFQTDAKNAIFNYFENGGKGNPLVCMPTGCHAKNTEILMYDGSVKTVQHVREGDKLMGPDFKSRTVYTLIRGYGRMFKITPIKGESFIVNGDHILSLKTTQEKSNEFYIPGRLIKGNVENITVSDYLNKSKWYKHTRKLWRAPANFPVQEKCTIDPWIFGCLLGDGSLLNSINLTTMDNEIALAAYSLAKQFDLKVRVETKANNLASTYYITGEKGKYNSLILAIYNLRLYGSTSNNKFIPDCYKLGDVETRLNVLAGLIDTDGSLSKNSIYDYVSKSKQLAKDVQFIARSLGLSANLSECRKGCQTGAIGTYYRVCISGNISIVPVHLARKKALPRLQKKDPSVTGFSIEEVEKDYYYGFNISDDHLYLTSDFMVHHNSGKSVVIADFLQSVFRHFPNQRVLMLTHVWKLIQQNAQRLQQFWPTAPLGIHSAGLGARDTTMPIIFGGVQSVVKTLEKDSNAFGHRDLILVDECFSPDTEILTESGFIRFDELGLQKVAQYNIKSRIINFDNPIKYIKRPATDGLLKLETAKNFNFMVTPGHEMIVNDEKIRADKVKSNGYSKIPVAGFACGEDENLEYWEKFAICFQADGNLHRKNIDGTCICSFTFSKDRKLKEFELLMQETKFKYKLLDERESKGNVKKRFRYMVYLPALIDKTIVDYFNITTMSLNKAKSIIEYMNLWDGHVANENTYLYTTVNKKMADFYQAVATLAGYRTNLTMVVDNRKETFSDCYRLFITKSINEIQTQTWKPEKIEYSGDVYCVSMPEGNIITRRGGKVIITGNCHLLGSDEDSAYLKIIAALTKINPYLKVIGFTATPYRLKMGTLTDGGLFSDICFNICTHEWFKRLVAEGYLSPLVGKPTSTVINGISNLSITAGDFNQKQAEDLVDTDEITYSACKEFLEIGYDRNKAMIFAAGVKNAEHIASMLESFGASVTYVHSKLSADENKKRLAAYDNDEYWCIVGANMLTTGYDNPRIDLIGDFQPTCSPGKHVQKYGRGTRVWFDKQNCRIADFVGNIGRNGPIDDPVLPRKPGAKTGEPPPIKICSADKLLTNKDKDPKNWKLGCGEYNHASARFCCDCAEEFNFATKLFATAFNDAPMKPDENPIFETTEIKRPIQYVKHEGKDKGLGIVSPPSVKAIYPFGIRSLNVFLCFEHTGKPRRIAHEWWKRHSVNEPPATVEEFLNRTGELRVPKSIMVHTNLKFPEIMNYEF